MTAASEAIADQAPTPRWIAPSLRESEGRDPLGLQTTTQDRLMPLLLPGILELSRRARYFAFHAFLLDEYRRRRLPADNKSLSMFILRREWDLGLAVQRCPNDCGSSPVGARRLSDLARRSGPFARGESVESGFGGYGLYYRSPMTELGVVARAGTMLGEQPIPIDVLRDTERAQRLAAEFRSAVETTEYYQRAMWTSDPLPAAVVDEYAAVACLCRLRERPGERNAVHDAIFASDPPAAPDSAKAEPSAGATPDAGAVQRRRSVGHYLNLVATDPNVPWSGRAYRDALWSYPQSRSEGHALVAGQWAALIAKDVWQELICSVWSQFCRAGLTRSREVGRGLTHAEVREVASNMVEGPPAWAVGYSTAEVAAALDAASLIVTDRDGEGVNVAAASLDTLRRLTAGLDTATSAVVVLLELARRTNGRADPGWVKASGVRSVWQPSISEVLTGAREHLDRQPSIGETLWWLVSRFIIPVHERIAYSKLPDFTFRFRWEEGLLRFYDHGIERFPLAAIRADALRWLTWDLGLWEGDEPEQSTLTDRGIAFVNEVLR
ncbi:hypothetical protein OHA77_24675 [Streptosporangium sp. NBC_01639]|uniref:hypothetical protein n=1 Tax=Streptosporangium sp. NBC_01639 TaxID=2975948 RepID=UPI003870E7FD|nr:hypothetical protein OHA77_24675 [Streptosporangium sp. NBC_01639]